MKSEHVTQLLLAAILVAIVYGQLHQRPKNQFLYVGKTEVVLDTRTGKLCHTLPDANAQGMSFPSCRP
jgi:hypothetical protein